MRNDLCKTFQIRTRSRGATCSRQLPQDLESLPQREGMRARYAHASYSSDQQITNASAIRRWLNSQVGRSWNSVYRALCANYDRRKFINRVLLDFVVDQLESRIFFDTDGTPMTSSRWGGHPVDGLYVHPDTGILCHSHPDGYRKSRYAQSVATQERLDEQARMRRIISADVQLHKLDGIWFHVTLAAVPKATQVQVMSLDEAGNAVYKTKTVEPAWVHDMVFKLRATGIFAVSRYSLRERYGVSDVYAKAKRQLSHAELKAYGLFDVPAGSLG